MSKLFTKKYIDVISSVGDRCRQPARGVSMLEYVLIAAVAIVLAGLFVTPLRNAFTTLLGNVGDFVGGGAAEGSPAP